MLCRQVQLELHAEVTKFCSLFRREACGSLQTDAPSLTSRFHRVPPGAHGPQDAFINRRVQLRRNQPGRQRRALAALLLQMSPQDNGGLDRPVPACRA